MSRLGVVIMCLKEKVQKVLNWFEKKSAAVMTIVAIIMCVSLLQNHGAQNLTRRSLNQTEELLRISRESLDQTKESLQMNRDSLELQKHDLYLTHKPIVFVTIPPTRSDANSNPLKDTFLLTNTGKLPAKNVAVSVTINQVIGEMILIDNSQIIPILEQITLYPGVNLAFWIPEAIHIGGDVSKTEINFIIKYEGQGIEGEMREEMRFIHTKDITKWLHVGPKYDIFSKERKRIRELNRSDTGSK